MATTQQQQQSSIAWFLSMIKGLKGSAGLRKRVDADYFDPKKDATIGQMFFFYYDAKLKDELPYWDKFPLVIVLDIDATGFLGLNLHYLPPRLRKMLLDRLLKYKMKAGSPRAFMKISYPFLKAVMADKMFQVCVHRYLHNHLRSNFIIVHEGAWENASMLPVQKFQGATARQVWSNR